MVNFRYSQPYSQQDIKRYLVRKVSKAGLESTNAPLAANEIKVLSKLSSTVCATFLKYYYDEQAQTLYSDYCRYGSLKMYLKQTMKFLSIHTKLWILYITAEALMLL